MNSLEKWASFWKNNQGMKMGGGGGLHKSIPFFRWKWTFHSNASEQSYKVNVN